MRCFGKFTNDRLCDLCLAMNNQEYLGCKEVKENKVSQEGKLRDIRSRCIYRTNCWDEYTPFYGCNKEGNGHGRFAKECNVTMECPGQYKEE